MEFKDKLKQLRLSKDLSQEALAKELMTSRSTYAKWETGIRLPNSASLQLIANYFNIEVSQLFDDKETTNLAIKTNERLNDLTIAVKNEDKNNTLIKLANLYRYLPAYANNFSKDLNYVSLLETKSNIFKAYVFVNLDNWDEAIKFTNKSIENPML